MAEMQNQQNAFLEEGAKRIRGKDAQRINILVARAVANAVRSTLGPKGMDKMIVDEMGDVTISNDGATILKEISIEHPVGKMMVDIAKTQDSEIGDGTTTAVVVAGELLAEAEKLLDNGIHPSSIINGYRLATTKALEFYNAISYKIGPKDSKKLYNIAVTSMTGKAAESSSKLAQLVVDAVSQIAIEDDKKIVLDNDYIKVEKKEGASLDHSELIRGIVIDKEIVSNNMPKKISNAKILLLDVALEIKSPETDTKIQITSPDQLQQFLDQEERMIQDMVDKIIATGANVVICQKGIDDLAQHFLAESGIMAIRRVKKSDIDKLAKATGAKVASRLKEINKNYLGNAETVRETKISGEEMIFVEGCKDPKAVTILIRGGTQHVVDEAERAVVDALGSVSSAIKSGKYVAGGGACEIEVAMRLRDYAKDVGGREQLAIEGFATALEIIPRTLAESAGLNPLDILVALKNKHKKNEIAYGVDVLNATISDMEKLNVIEPTEIKIQAINSGSEVSQMILRIDDIIAGSGRSKGGMHNMPPGMGDAD
ncbi:MAG: thermosome subunit beta [Candidatus ainarchaeum sp.]|nr:thermosome subunit beta [Candidatus ainarchaeum sp.]